MTSKLTKMTIDKKIIGIIFVLVVFSLMCFCYIHFRYSEGVLNSKRPPISTTFDIFYHSYFSKIASETGYSIYYPYSWIGSEKGLTLQPPIYYTALASFAQVNSIHPYDLSFIFVILLKIFSLLGFFIIIKNVFDSKIASVALAFSIITPVELLFLFIFGYSLDITAVFFLPAAFFMYWMLVTKDLGKNNYLVSALFGLLVAASFQSHAVEATFFVAFLALSSIYLLIFKQVGFKHIKYGLMSAVVFLVCIFEFLPVFLKGYGTVPIITEAFKLVSRVPYHPALPFGFFLIALIIAGFIVVLTVWKTWANKHFKLVVLVFPFYWLLASFSYNIGFNSNYVYRMIFSFWPLIYILPAIFLVAVINSFIKKPHGKIIGITSLILMIIGISFYLYKPIEKPYSIYTPQLWESIVWIRDKTPKNAFVFSLNPYIHEFQMFNERLNAKGDLNIQTNVENIIKLCNGTFPEAFKFHAHAKDLYMIERTGWNRFNIRNTSTITATKKKIVFKELPELSLPIEEFDYVVVQYDGIDYKKCIEFFIDETRKRNFSIVWKNDYYMIMQNDNSIKIKSKA